MGTGTIRRANPKGYSRNPIDNAFKENGPRWMGRCTGFAVHAAPAAPDCEGLV